MNKNVTKVFLVDDDEISLLMFQEALEAKGLEVATSTGTNTVHQIRQFKPDVIILDIVMPVQSGFEICAELKQDPVLHDIPTIILTAEPTKTNQTRSRNMGIVGFLAKPVSKDALIAAIEQQDALHQIKKAWHNASSIMDNLLTKYAAPTKIN